jgi:ubiquinone biosynthesis monooxygenase Coq7
MGQRKQDLTDQLIGIFDQGLRTVFGAMPAPERPSPGIDAEPDLTDQAERRLVASLMRVNHAGEVSAQALYQGQSLTAHSETIKESLARSAQEENDHLAWCRQRITELGGRPSYLDPVWYAGSFCIGALAGLAGDGVNLGFLAETERQVVAHLESHLHRLPEDDKRSRRILEQMKIDEAHHSTVAVRAGAIELPDLVKRGMQMASRVMTTLAYRI